MSKHTILCGNCRTPVEGPEEPRPEDQITCSNCGQSDKFEAVLESAKAFATDSAANSLNTSLAKAVKGSKFVKFKASPIPRRAYKWIIADFDV
jgi:hypothetical protein